MMLNDNKKIFITKPLLPEIDIFYKEIKDIFSNKQITNMGEKHNLLESRLKDELKVSHCSLFNNGTTALLVALKAMNLPVGSEVITTPFTFAATPHSIVWNSLKPVFCDIEPNTMTIDADKIEDLITPNTSAILGVHVYGFPCNVKKIDKIAQKHNLKVIYDAAHCFSTEINGVGIGNFGDISMFSFHATKLFNTIEGGCLTYNNPELVQKIYNLRNFGIKNEEVIEEVGINGKMNEFSAAMGLLNLQIYKEEQNKRKKVKEYYDDRLSKIQGIRVPKMPDNVTNSYQYYPIVIEDDYPISRDELYAKFRKNNIFVRKYFYPACSDYECYKEDFSIIRTSLDVVNDLKNRVLCLPYYGDLEQEKIKFIMNLFKNFK